MLVFHQIAICASVYFITLLYFIKVEAVTLNRQKLPVASLSWSPFTHTQPPAAFSMKTEVIRGRCGHCETATKQTM
jgi:hypothetical protein